MKNKSDENMKERKLKPRRFEKTRSPNHIIIQPNSDMNDKDDPNWFMEALTISNKLGVIIDEMTTTPKYMERHIKSIEQNGWVESKNK